MKTATASATSRPKHLGMLPVLAALVLAAGIIALLVVRSHPTHVAVTATPGRSAAQATPKAANRKVPLDRSARAVAGRFILTAVQRHHLAEAWKIAGPDIRQNLTYKQWLTGNIAVIPYTAPIGLAPLHVVYSHPREALLEVVLFPKPGVKAKPQDFFLGLIKVRAASGHKEHWVVNYWLPRAAPAVPLRPGG